MKIKKAIIPAAGLGTRLYPITQVISKEMLPIINKPAIAYVIEEAFISGIEKICIITNKRKSDIEEYVESFYHNISFMHQDEPKGLGHAVLQAEEFIDDEPFAVLLPDEIIDSRTPCIKQLIDIHNVCESNTVLGVQRVKLKDVSKYGIIETNKIDNKILEVNNLVEKPTVFATPSTFAIMGRYILTPKILGILKTTKPGKNNEIQLTDALKELLLYEDIKAYHFDGTRFDVGTQEGLLNANIYYSREALE